MELLTNDLQLTFSGGLHQQRNIQSGTYSDLGASLLVAGFNQVLWFQPDSYGGIGHARREPIDLALKQIGSSFVSQRAIPSFLSLLPSGGRSLPLSGQQASRRLTAVT